MAISSPQRSARLINAADMTLANVVRLNIYTTDMDGLLHQFPVVNERFGPSGQRFATTLDGVASLAAPDLGSEGHPLLGRLPIEVLVDATRITHL